MLPAILVIAAGLAGGCRQGRDEQGAEPPATGEQRAVVASRPPVAGEVMPVRALIRLTSPAFADGDTIPARYTCDGADLSPPLRWSHLPPGTKALALICDDPDAPGGTWQHWLLVNLSPDLGGLAEGEGSTGETLPAGAVLGVNSWGKRRYGGPCPPPGKPHRYYFRLFALSEPVPGAEAGLDRAALDAALAGRVLAEGRLMGTYRR